MKNKTILVILASLLLSGCIAAVVASATGMVVYDRRSVFTMESDARIFHVINKTVVGDPRFRDSHIVISSFNQTVLLAGQTLDPELRRAAEKVARNTPNVVRVYNEISIQEPTSFSQRSKDSWITGQIRTQMLAKKGLESGSIRVVTENSVVYLMGIVTHRQANLAVDVARKVNGVHKVVKVFRYIT